ncbi:unnamed protein product [Dibothriocephalus latus]|uniref:Uncharacterized protein n=1 Tax=Dibothriocephalus latus TaxID=60516 RepID=A0A3P7LTD8_DIBLA|nr:unnamed protein product [Dibothriocephalus latus]
MMYNYLSDAPEYPYLEKDEIYGSEQVNCMSKAYPVHGRLLKAETNDRNGGIERCGSSYCFTIYSVYGYYNVQCTFEGAHEAVGFTFVKTLNATYIGPEYVPTLQRRSDLAAYAFDTFILIECLLFILLLGLFTILGVREQKERVKQLTMRANQKSREYKPSILKDLDGQYVNVDMMEFTKNDHLRLVTMTTLFDGCYDQFAKKTKKPPEEEPATETRPTYRATVRKAMNKMLTENFNESSSSSEDDYDTETATELSRSGNNPFSYDYA